MKMADVWKVMKRCRCRCAGWAWGPAHLRIGPEFDARGRVHHPGHHCGAGVIGCDSPPASVAGYVAGESECSVHGWRP